MGIWKEYIIGDLCEVGRGSSPRPIIDQRYFVDGEIPWIKIADATASGKHIYKTKEYVNEFGASFSRYLEPNSLIISASGSIGLIKFLGIKGCIHDGWLYISNYNEKLIDKEYLYYFFINYSTKFNNFSSGAAIQNINTEILRKTKIKIPSIQIQQKIASILSAYDELIENNKQRIKLLEVMAEEIYKEWFVRLRFPGYENTKMVDGMHEGWKKVKLIERFDISLGGTPSRENDNYWNGNIPWINSGKVNDLRVIDASDYITELGLKKSATKILPMKTTLLAITGATLGQVSLLEIDACANQSVIGIKDPLSKVDEFIFLTMKDKIKDLMNYASGGAQQHINKANVEEVEIILPDEKVMEKFIQIIQPQFDLISNLMFKNIHLQQTRDMLLPRLISGKLSVEHLVEMEEENLLIAAEPKMNNN